MVDSAERAPVALAVIGLGTSGLPRINVASLRQPPSHPIPSICVGGGLRMPISWLGGVDVHHAYTICTISAHHLYTICAPCAHHMLTMPTGYAVACSWLSSGSAHAFGRAYPRIHGPRERYEIRPVAYFAPRCARIKSRTPLGSGIELTSSEASTVAAVESVRLPTPTRRWRKLWSTSMDRISRGLISW
jgi:hypothetical protein